MGFLLFLFCLKTASITAIFLFLFILQHKIQNKLNTHIKNKDDTICKDIKQFDKYIYISA